MGGRVMENAWGEKREPPARPSCPPSLGNMLVHSFTYSAYVRMGTYLSRNISEWCLRSLSIPRITPSRPLDLHALA